MLYPVTFQPILKERVWGGRKLEELYQKPLPPGAPIGESWEISDRPGETSIINNGKFAGETLHWLMENYGDDLLGATSTVNNRFPLLVKILDAQEKLSLQVHPPEAVAAKLKGEPKTEMWYIAHADPGAELYVGLKRGVTREQFEHEITTGNLADCFHRIAVKAGDAMFLPSGRVHAIGGGLVIFEIQQNSDTTYRVFDWNRKGLDGKPRALHIPESLASIDFNDFAPKLVEAAPSLGPNYSTRLLVQDRLFKVMEIVLRSGEFNLPRLPKVQIVGLVSGHIMVNDGVEPVELKSGQFCMVPGTLRAARISALAPSTFLLTMPT